MAQNILLVDLASIGHAMWHVCANEPDPNAASIKTVERVRALASGQPHVAICLDSPPYFRMDVSPDYKAKRDKENNAAVSHQLAVAADTLRADGFPVWAVKGYEADDAIASATAYLMRGTDGQTVTIASADKDLLQLISDRVSIKSLKDGSLIGPDEVKLKFGVSPDQVRDYLSLVGDASDNIKGANGIGPKKAAELLTKYGNLDDLYRELDARPSSFTNGQLVSLREFQSRLSTVRELITLKSDVPLPFEQVFRARVPVDVATFGQDEDFEERAAIMEYDGGLPRAEAERLAAGITKDIQDTMQDLHTAPNGALEAHIVARADAAQTDPGMAYAQATAEKLRAASERVVDTLREQAAALEAAKLTPPPMAPPAAQAAAGATIGQPTGRIDQRSQQFVPGPTAADYQSQPPAAPSAPPVTLPVPAPARVLEAETLPPPAADFTMQLEPRSIGQAKQIAADLFASRMFSAYGNAPAVLSTIMAGRELGFQAMASLRAFHIIEGKPALSAGAIHSLVLTSGKAKYFRCTERTAEKATFTTQRGDEPPMSLTFTIAEARQAWAKRAADGSCDEKSFLASGYGKNPADLLVARAITKLARLVYPDVCHGLYDPSELQ